MDHTAGNEVPWSFWWLDSCPWGILAPIIVQIRSQSYSLTSPIFFITIPHILWSNPLWYPKLAKGSRGNRGESGGIGWGSSGGRRIERDIDLFNSIRVLEIMHFFEVSTTLPFDYFASFPFTTDLVWISMLGWGLLVAMKSLVEYSTSRGGV